MDIEQLITGHFNETLSEEEEALFQQKFESDASFRALAEQMEIEILAARKAGRKQLKEQFDNWEQTEFLDKTNKQKLPFNNILKLGIAAAVVFAIGIYLLIPASGEDLFVSYYKTYENFEYTVIRNDADVSSSLQAKAYQAYDDGDFEVAKDYFTDYLAGKPDDVPARFFRGICFIEIGQLQAAMADLSSVLNSGDSFYKRPANWYLALVYLKLQNEDHARQLLQELAETSGDYQQQATALLKEL